MDWSTIIMSLVSSVISGGGVATIAFFKENKRKKQLENEAMASAQWRELYEKADAKNDTLGIKIEALYKENNLIRDNNNDLTSQNIVLKIHKCEVPGCTMRKPPRGY